MIMSQGMIVNLSINILRFELMCNEVEQQMYLHKLPIKLCKFRLKPLKHVSILLIFLLILG